ncbi:hypothetical protein [Anaeromicrobium sediminis]|uniref:Uncharacterized protein n=1 Tax=Anaeromicrobium sediminis TaxID=1478221 RepID=A0A267MN85_9FIRM|nr:hypothetical protein [Anaeromicrobium sediminis]PAB60378.1 hypothetical protein CCE28_05645 [Anaeromicrobium sediminis]
MENLAEKKDDKLLEINQEKIYEELKTLKDQYTSLVKEVQALDNNEKSINSLRQSIDSLFHEFNEVNKNMEDITNILNEMSETNNLNTENNNRPLDIRGMTVKTLSSILSVVDNTMEKTSGFGEGLEDLIAEAQYENKRKRLVCRNGQLNKMGRER